MSKSETIEVDPSELSDEVRDSLTEELNIDSDYADEYVENLKVNELVDKNPDKTGFLDSSIAKLKSLYNSVSDYFNKNTIYAKIVDVRATENDYVILKFDHPKLNKTARCKKKPDDPMLSNIMEYHRVNNASELNKKSVPIFNPNNLLDTFTDTYVTIPNNTSLSGRIRYRIYGSIKNFRMKVPFTTKDSADLALRGVIYNGFALLVGLSISSVLVGSLGGESAAQSLPSIIVLAVTIPLMIALIINLISSAYLALRIVLFVLSRLFKGDFNDVSVDRFI